jgi:hypothetical protein
MLLHFLQRTSATAFFTNFKRTAKRYMLRTSPDDPLAISRNLEKSVGVVRSEPVPLCSGETTPQGSASLFDLSSFGAASRQSLTCIAPDAAPFGPTCGCSSFSPLWLSVLALPKVSIHPSGLVAPGSPNPLGAQYSSSA